MSFRMGVAFLLCGCFGWLLGVTAAVVLGWLFGIGGVAVWG